MEPAQETQICSNCESPFPVDRIDLHEAYCIRNIRKCPQCQAFVDVRQLEAHNLSVHSKKPCGFCKTEFMPEELTNHTQTCPRRPKQCQYCETDVAFVEFQAHEGVCGARTRQCQTCNTHVMMRDLVTHEPRCRERAQQPPAPIAMVPPTVPIIPTVHERVPPIPYENRHHHIPMERRMERDVSTNNTRQNIDANFHHHHGGGGDRSLSTNRINDNKIGVLKKHKEPTKPNYYAATIPPENIKKVVDILPISVRLTLKNKELAAREPLKNRN